MLRDFGSRDYFLYAAKYCLSFRDWGFRDSSLLGMRH